MSARELWLVAAGLLFAIAALPLVGGAVLWTRPLWMDEVVTAFIISEPSPAAMVSIIGRGGDWNPPLLHVLLWPLAKVITAPTILLRTFAVVCTAIALLLVYATLRRRIGRAGSLAGMMAVVANPVVIQQAFEGRFYAPWLLFAAGFAWSLGLDAERDRSLRRDVAIAVFALLLCTIHWFAVFSLGAMALGVIGVSRLNWKSAVRQLAPAIVGVIALAVCAPLALSQRASATGLLWVLPLSFAQIKVMAKLYWFALPVLPAALLLSAILRRRLRGAAPMSVATIDRGVAALAATALMPLVLVALSIVLQPSMVDRYAIVAALAWAPLVALAIDAGNRAIHIAGLAFVALMLVNATKFSINARSNYASQVAGDAAAYKEAAVQPVPVVFIRLHTIYPVAGLERGTGSARYLALPDSAIFSLYPSEKLGWLRHNMQLDRDQALYHARIFGFPKIVWQADLDTTANFILLAADLNLPGGYKQAERWGQAVLPRHRVTRLTTTLSLFQRETPAEPRRR